MPRRGRQGAPNGERNTDTGKGRKRQDHIQAGRGSDRTEALKNGVLESEGGQTSYSQMQDRFHEEIGKRYGLERGEVGSNAKHRTKAQYEAEAVEAGA